MQKNLSIPHVSVSKTGDVLIQGTGNRVLFFPQAQVAKLLESPELATAILITDVGAAAIATLLAGNASFDVMTLTTAQSTIESVVLRFVLPNGLTVAYTTDEDVFNHRTELQAQGVDLIVTANEVDWNRRHAPFLGEVISNMSPTLPQIAMLQYFDPKYLAELVSEALAQRAKTPEQNSNTTEEKP
jgi:hypothetical protein